MKKILLLTLLIFLLSGCTEQAAPPVDVAPSPTETMPLYAQSSKSIIVLSYPAPDFLSLKPCDFGNNGSWKFPGFFLLPLPCFRAKAARITMSLLTA